MLKKKLFVILVISLFIAGFIFGIFKLYSFYYRKMIMTEADKLARKKIEEIEFMKYAPRLYPLQELKLIYKSKERYKYKKYKYLEISLNGKRWGFIAKKGRKEYLVVDEKGYGSYDNVWCFRFFENNIFRAEAINKKRDEIHKRGISGWYLKHFGDDEYDITDNGVAGPYNSNFVGYGDDDWCYFPRFRKHLLCGALMPKKKGKSYVTMNGKKFGPYDDGTCYHKLILSLKDELRNGYCIAKKKRKKYILIDGKQYGPYDDAGIPTDVPKVSKRYGFWINKGCVWEKDNCMGGKYYVVIDGKKEYGPYDYIDRGHPLFTIDEAKWGFIAREGKNEYVIINGGEYGPYKIADLIPKEKTMIFGGIDEEGYVVLYQTK